ncbi:Major Facilitator Superfamily [Acrodontium crateriforme]|uniref:Major Facilitator Superfamily n=1 Tax=Acrodontium crateriforme TaxID=150365 RepID=A0AAQ3M407_9PEZI|nr:Major Facilitator Superfamily [Acrodontium crateriforme]
MLDEEKHHSLDPEVEKNLPAQLASAIRSGSVPETILKHSHDADEAMKAFQSHAGQILEIDEATNKRLLRRIDWNLIPIMCVVYGLNYLDKTTISYASIMNMKQDIHLVGDDYNWVSSMFYFGYLAWEYPTNLFLQRLPLAKYSGACVILWGLVLSCFAAVENYSGAIAIRFFLGVTEAAVTPGFALLTSQWYTTKEQGTRTGIWFSFNGWAQILGGLVAYGIAKGTSGESYHGLEGWKIVFLVTGLLTVVVGIIFLFTVPDNQMNARWLNEDDRVLAIERIRVNQQGVGGISNFFSQLIKSFGYTSQQSLLYGTPGGAIEVVTLIAAGYLGDRYQNRLLFGAIGLLIAATGMILIVALPLTNSKGRLGGYYMTQASPTAFVAILSLISSNIAGYTKKTTVAAMYLIGYCVGNIIGPQTFRPKDQPRYVPAEITIIVCYCTGVAIMAFIYVSSRRRNSRKARLRAEPGYVKLENQEWLDLTDGENPEFVYTL